MLLALTQRLSALVQLLLIGAETAGLVFSACVLCKMASALALTVHAITPCMHSALAVEIGGRSYSKFGRLVSGSPCCGASFRRPVVHIWSRLARSCCAPLMRYESRLRVLTTCTAAHCCVSGRSMRLRSRSHLAGALPPLSTPPRRPRAPRRPTSTPRLPRSAAYKPTQPHELHKRRQLTYHLRAWHSDLGLAAYVATAIILICWQQPQAQRLFWKRCILDAAELGSGILCSKRLAQGMSSAVQPYLQDAVVFIA